jgi:hypothetical protein
MMQKKYSEKEECQIFLLFSAIATEHTARQPRKQTGLSASRFIQNFLAATKRNKNKCCKKCCRILLMIQTSRKMFLERNML